MVRRGQVNWAWGPQAAGAVLLGTALCGHATEAEDLTAIPFEKLAQQEVLSASRLARQISDSPAAVSIVTAADIRRMGYRSLAEVLNGMRGLYTTWDRRYEYLGGRGFGAPGDYIGRIMVLVDGHTVQDNVFNQAFIDQSALVDMELIERVEYVPGTGAVNYGNNALLGIVNVVTKRGADVAGAEVSAEVGSWGSRRGRVSWGERLASGMDVLLSYSHLASDGQTFQFPYFAARGFGDGTVQGRDWEQSHRFFAKLAYEGLVVEAAQSHRIKASPLPRRENAFGLRYDMNDQSTHLNARFDRDLGRGWSMVSRLYYGRYDDRTLRRYAPIDPQDQFGRNATHGNWWGLDQRFAYTGWRGHTVVVGAEARRDSQILSRLSLTDQEEMASVEYRFPYSNRTLSVFAADEWALSSTWRLNLGARIDRPNAWDCSVSPCVQFAERQMVSPRLALLWAPALRWQVKAAFNRAYRLPGANEISSATDSSVYRPERVATREVVVERELDEHTRWLVTAYHNQIADQHAISPVDGVERFDRSSETQGVEGQWDQSWSSGWHLRASFSWQHAKDTQGERLMNSPSRTAKLTLGAPVGSTMDAGLELQAYGSRRTGSPLNGKGIAQAPGRWLPGFALLHASVGSREGQGAWSWRLTVRNVLDRRYEVPALPVRWNSNGALMDALAMDGRSVWLQVNYRLGR